MNKIDTSPEALYALADEVPVGTKPYTAPQPPETRSLAFQYRDERVAEGMKPLYEAYGHKPPKGPKT